MRLLLAALLGLAGAIAAWKAAAPNFRQPTFLRRNYRDVDVPVGAGVLLAVAAIAAEAPLSLADTLQRHPSVDRPARLMTLLVVVAFALLGLIDDLGAHGDDRGFAGHLRALAKGRLTTGGIKLLGGGLVAVVAAASAGQPGLGRVLVGAAVIALAANLGNLFDRAPGRTIKVGLVAAIPLLALASVTDRHALSGVAVIVGAAVGLLGFDLGEQLMLGDAGSNVIGAALGLGFVLTTGFVAWVIAAIVLALLNAASERVSFSRVIDRVAPLRALDRLGRRRS
jgi:UDP-N-acetylmuramyl pentapeptide phosphotransferase/UDP-N-acetylglucosamine-1-phosphate transferase